MRFIIRTAARSRPRHLPTAAVRTSRRTASVRLPRCSALGSDLGCGRREYARDTTGAMPDRERSDRRNARFARPGHPRLNGRGRGRHGRSIDGSGLAGWQRHRRGGAVRSGWWCCHVLEPLRRAACGLRARGRGRGFVLAARSSSSGSLAGSLLHRWLRESGPLGSALLEHPVDPVDDLAGRAATGRAAWSRSSARRASRRVLPALRRDRAASAVITMSSISGGTSGFSATAARISIVRTRMQRVDVVAGRGTAAGW